MELPVNHFKRAIAAGRAPVGAWLVSAAASAAEALGCIGFDFLVVDMEHTPLDTPQMVGILQIETMSAFGPLEAIAAVPGVDSIFIGPADLSASMGFLGDMGNSAVQEKLRAGAQTCKRLGKPCGIVGANPEIVANFLDYGFSWVAVGSDLAMLAGRAQEFLGAVRNKIGATKV